MPPKPDCPVCGSRLGGKASRGPDALYCRDDACAYNARRVPCPRCGATGALNLQPRILRTHAPPRKAWSPGTTRFVYECRSCGGRAEVLSDDPR